MLEIKGTKQDLESIKTGSYIDKQANIKFPPLTKFNSENQSSSLKLSSPIKNLTNNSYKSPHSVQVLMNSNSE